MERKRSAEALRFLCLELWGNERLILLIGDGGKVLVWKEL